MPGSDFIPAGDDAFARWHDQLKTAATDIGATVGVTPADLTLLGTDNTAVHTGITDATTTAAAAKQSTRNKDNAIALAERNARALARRIKAHPAYTPAIGEDLGIEAPAAGVGGLSASTESAAMNQEKPTLKGRPLNNGAAEIKFTKASSEAVAVYCRREGDADFVFLARDTHSPYVDNRPLLVAGKPERREYQGWYVRNDEEYGQASDIIVVVCSP